LVCAPHPWQSKFTFAALYVVIFSAIIAPCLTRSLAQYDVLIPTQENVRIAELAYGTIDKLQAVAHMNWLTIIHGWFTTGTLWVGGWSLMIPASGLGTAYQWLLFGGVIAWIVSLAGPVLRDRAQRIFNTRVGVFCLLLVLSFIAALAAHAVSCRLAWGMVMTNSWYAAAAIPMMLLLVAGGYARLLPSRAAAVPILGIGVVFLITELHGFCVRMPMQYAAATLWEGGLWRLRIFQPALLGPYTLLAALIIELVLLLILASDTIRRCCGSRPLINSAPDAGTTPGSPSGIGSFF